MPRIRLLRGLWFHGFKGGRSSYSKNRTIPLSLFALGSSALMADKLGEQHKPPVFSLPPSQPPKVKASVQSSLLLKELQRSEPSPASEQLAVRNLVLKGGGPKGLAYVTALQELESQLGNLDGVLRVAGSSAGSIVSSLLAVGYQPKELRALLQEEDAEGRPVMLSFALDGSQYEWVQQLKEGEALPKLSEDTIYLQVKGDACIAYWNEDGEVVSQSCSAKAVEPVLKELATDGEKSSEKTLLKQVKAAYGLTKADQAVIEAINRVSSSSAPTVRAMAEVMSSPYLSAKLWRQGGVCRGVFFERWLNRKLSQKIIEQESEGITDSKQLAELEARYQTPTLRDLQDLINKQVRKGLFRYKHLYSVTAQQYQGYTRCCVYTSEEVSGRPEELTCFGQVKTHIEDSEAGQQLPIAKVARASMSIPYFFTPVELTIAKEPSKYSLREYLFTDGGVLDNYPINLFDSNVYHSLPDVSQLPSTSLSNPETLGFYLYDKADRSRAKELWRTFKLLVLPESWQASTTKSTVKEDRSQLPRNIKLDTRGVTVFDFTMPVEKQEELLKAGTVGTRDFFEAAPHAAGRLKQEVDKLSHHHSRKFEQAYQAYKKYSNLDDWLISDNYVVHPQYYELVDTIAAQKKDGHILISISGLEGSGKSELAKYLGQRYLQAHFWVEWRGGYSQQSTPALVWFWLSENPEHLWVSCQTLALRLGMPRKEIPKLGSMLLQQKSPAKLRHDVEQQIAQLLSIIKQRCPSLSVCYVFDNVQASSNLSIFPGLHFYLQNLRGEKSWHIVTGDDSGLCPTNHNHVKKNLDSGLGLRLGMDLLNRYLLHTSYTPEDLSLLARQLGYIPMNLIVAGMYIEKHRCSISHYLNLQNKKQKESQKAFEEVGPAWYDYLSEKLPATVQSIIQLSLDQLKKEKNGQALMELLQFCSGLHAEEIPYSLLQAFTSRMHPGWSADRVNAELQTQLKLLKQYSLIETNHAHSRDGEVTYEMHRLTQKIVSVWRQRNEEQILAETLLYSAKNERGEFLIMPKWMRHYDKALQYCNHLSRDTEMTLRHYFLVAALGESTNDSSMSLGQARAQAFLGLCYASGENVAQDWAKAVIWFRKAAEQGEASAQSNLGWCYAEGKGVTQDWVQAVTWYRKAAKQGFAAAQLNLALCYEIGQGVAQDWVQAISWYREAALQEDTQAQFNLGLCYAEGLGVEQDWTQAVEWFRKAAVQGLAQAQFNLGVCYEKNQGVAQDWTQAIVWYRKAAEQGYPQAQFNLGVCYANGHGVKQDWAQAVAWFRKAAEQGLVEAQKTLNVLSEKKPELPGNHVKELFHFTPSKPDSSEKDFPSEKATEFPNSKR